MIQEWEGGREGWGWLVSQDSGEDECLVRGSVIVEQGEVDWQNIVGQTVEYCCRRQKKKGTVATRVWFGNDKGEQAETGSVPDMGVDAEQFDNTWKQAVCGREITRKHQVLSRMSALEQEAQGQVTSWTQAVKGRATSREQVVQGKVTHWVPEQQAGVIQTEEGEVIVSR